MYIVWYQPMACMKKLWAVRFAQLEEAREFYVARQHLHPDLEIKEPYYKGESRVYTALPK